MPVFIYRTDALAPLAHGNCEISQAENLDGQTTADAFAAQVREIRQED